MNPYQKTVQEFHQAIDQNIGDTPAFRDRELRAKLIMEEAVETVAALGFAADAYIYTHVENGQPLAHWNEVAEFHKQFTQPDLAETIDGLCDLAYVLFGTAVAMGIDLDPHFAAVHQANMAKAEGPIREDGKRMKPEGWQPPNHWDILNAAS